MATTGKTSPKTASKTTSKATEPKPATTATSKVTEPMPKPATTATTEPMPKPATTATSKVTEPMPKPATTATTEPMPKPATTRPKPIDMESLRAKWRSVKANPDSVARLKEYKRIYQEHEAMVNPENAEAILADNNELIRDNATVTADSRMNYDLEVLDLRARESICLEAYPTKLQFSPRSTFVKLDGEFKNSGSDRSSFDLIMENTKLFRIVESIALDGDPRAYLAPLLEGIEPEEIETFASMGTINDKLKDKLYKNLITFAVKVTNEGTVNDYGLNRLANNEKTEIQIGIRKTDGKAGKRAPACDVKYLEKWYQYVKDLLDITKKYAPEEKEFIDTLDNMETEMLKSRIYVKYSRWDKKLVMDYENELEEIFEDKPKRKSAGRKSNKMEQKAYNRSLLENMPPDMRKQMEDHFTQQGLPF